MVTYTVGKSELDEALEGLDHALSQASIFDKYYQNEKNRIADLKGAIGLAKTNFNRIKELLDADFADETAVGAAIDSHYETWHKD